MTINPRLFAVTSGSAVRGSRKYSPMRDSFNAFRVSQIYSDLVRLLYDDNNNNNNNNELTRWRLGCVTLGCWTYDREVVGSTTGRVTIKWLLLG